MRRKYGFLDKVLLRDWYNLYDWDYLTYSEFIRRWYRLSDKTIPYKWDPLLYPYSSYYRYPYYRRYYDWYYPELDYLSDC